MRLGEPEKTGIDRSEVFDRIRSHWLSNVTHDLSGALFAARGYLVMVLEESNGTLSEPQRRYLISSLENINRLVTLTQELNDFPGSDWFEFATIALGDLLQQAIGDIRATALGSNVEVIENIDTGPLTTLGDAAKLALALKSFLYSAFEFTGPGGTVQVGANQEDERIKVEFRASPGNGISGDKPSPDLALACKILRLHGGSAFVTPPAKTP